MIALTALALAFAQPAPAEASPAATAFQQLSGLVGTWRNADRPQSPLRIRFYLTAGGTVLVESWERTDGQPHSLTLYHRDGANLIATHYCPQGNQPRLALATSGKSLAFTFRDATDLDSGESHLHDLGFDLTDPNRPIRSEVYRQDDKAEDTVLHLTRADPPAALGLKPPPLRIRLARPVQPLVRPRDRRAISRPDAPGQRRQDRPLLLDVRPQILLHENYSRGERDFAAKQNASADTFLAAKEADKGMTEMSEKFRQTGGEIYLPAAE
jgi:hypothetical protein